jgi:hypothetical protein
MDQSSCQNGKAGKKEAASHFRPSGKRQAAANFAELLHQTRIKNLNAY